MYDFSFGNSLLKVCTKRKHESNCGCDASLVDMGNIFSKKFSSGLYIVTFDVLNLEHVRTVIISSNLCERLTIAIDAGNNYESENRLRYRWVRNTVGHIKNVSIVFIDLKNKTMLDSFARSSDIIFGWDFNDKLVKLVDIKRRKIVSYHDCSLPRKFGKSCVLKYWDIIPNAVRPYFVKKVLIIGGESTGKSTLGRNLSSYYNTNYLEEVGRTFCEECGTNKMMIDSDFSKLILTNKIRELEDCKYSNRVMFQDTDCLTTRFYMDFLNCDGNSSTLNKELSEVIARINNYDLVLFLEPDNEFVMDSVRSDKIAEDRVKYSEQLKSVYLKFGYNVVSLSGTYEEKLKKALEEVDRILDS